MLVKGIIEQKVDIYSYKVRVPFLNKVSGDSNPTSTENLSVATISTIPGIHSVFEEGDVVFIDFENDDFSDPVILGLLDRDSYKASYNNINTSTLDVQLTANLPYNTTIGEVTPVELSSLQGIKGNIQEQLSIQENTIETYMCEYGVTSAEEISYQFNKERAIFVNKNLPDNITGIFPLTQIKVEDENIIAEFEGLVSTSYSASNIDTRNLVRIVCSSDNGWSYLIKDVDLPAWSLSSGIPIPSGADLNDYVDEGNYHCALSATAGTISNIPNGARAFILKVINSTSQSVYRRQELFYFNTAEHWVRYAASATSKNWGSWFAVTYKTGTTALGIVKDTNGNGWLTSAVAGDDYAKPELVYAKKTSIASKSALDTQLTSWFNAMPNESERLFYITISGTWSPFVSGGGVIVHIQKGTNNGSAVFYGRATTATNVKITSLSYVSSAWSDFQDIITNVGGTVNGKIKVTAPATASATSDGSITIEHGTASNDAMLVTRRTDTGTSMGVGIGTGGTNHGIYSHTLGKWMIYGDASNVYVNGKAQNVTGTVAVANGGTGQTSFTANQAIISGSTTTGAFTSRAITNNTSTSGAVSRNTNLLTMNTLSWAINRTDSVGAANTSYTTYMARGESLLTSAPTASALANGQIAWIYG